LGVKGGSDPPNFFLRKCFFFEWEFEKNVFLEEKNLGGSTPPPNFSFSKIVFLDVYVFL